MCQKKSRATLGLVSFEDDERSIHARVFLETKIAPETLGLVQMIFLLFFRGQVSWKVRNVSENARPQVLSLRLLNI